MQSIRSLRGVAAVATLGVLGAVVATTGNHLRTAGTRADGELVYLPDARLLRPLVLGYNNVLADLLWFRTISYFGEHFRGDREYPWLGRMCDIVTDLDPRAEHVYRFAGLILPWAAHQPDEGIRLLAKGVANLPGSWLLRYHLGMTYYFFKRDTARAAASLVEAARLPDAPPLVGRLAVLLQAKQRGAASTLEFLRQMRETTTSPQMREVLERSIAEAEAALSIERLEEFVHTHRERTGHFPSDIAELVRAGFLAGEPPDPFGGHWMIDQQSGQVRSSTGRVPLAVHTTPLERNGFKTEGAE